MNIHLNAHLILQPHSDIVFFQKVKNNPTIVIVA